MRRPAESISPQRPQAVGDLNRYFKALSDETRRAILGILANKDCSVGEIVGHFGLAQPTISRHLAVLKQADLVSDRRQGQQVIYSLNPEALAAGAERFLSRFTSLLPH